jgi:hypothetical protein
MAKKREAAGQARGGKRARTTTTAEVVADEHEGNNVPEAPASAADDDDGGDNVGDGASSADEEEEVELAEDEDAVGRAQRGSSGGVQAGYYHPPTHEEMQRLRETEELFHSNILRLEVRRQAQRPFAWARLGSCAPCVCLGGWGGAHRRPWPAVSSQCTHWAVGRGTDACWACAGVAGRSPS